MQKDPKAMSLEDWIVAQSQVPAIRKLSTSLQTAKCTAQALWD